MNTANQLAALGFTPEQIAGATVNGKPVSDAVTWGGNKSLSWRDGNVIHVVIGGKPLGKPRMTRRDKWKQRSNVMRYRDWADHARAVLPKLPSVDQVDDLSWTAYFEPPASWSKKERLAAIEMPHRSKPDRDNIDKAILDVLFPKADSAIYRGTIEKLWDWEARIEIAITVKE